MDQLPYLLHGPTHHKAVKQVSLLLEQLAAQWLIQLRTALTGAAHPWIWIPFA